MKEILEHPAARVLIVDDDEIMRETARQSLITAGVVVSEAENGLQAMEDLGTSRPDIILMDVMMPEMDGFEATSAIRRLPDFEQTPILIMTALDDMESINRAFEVGATDFITKPINWVVLVERIRFMIRAVRMMDRQRTLQEKLVQAQKMEALGTLAGGVAHDLNNVLGGIVSYPDLLLFRTPVDSPLRKPLETIKQSGQKAAAIVQDLLTLARRGVVANESVNLNKVVDDYLNSPEHAKCMYHHGNVKVRTQLAPELPDIMGSPVQLSKTVMNLITNAAEAMPGGGTIAIRTKAGAINRAPADRPEMRGGEYVLVAVTDTGIGMPAEEKAKIFEPFYTKKKMGRSGTGLGMSVVWGTVEDHGGYIDVTTAEGKGTTFRLYFPVARNARVRKQSPSPLAAYRGSGETVLVVDDAEEQRDVAHMMLAQLGYKVHALESGEKAVAYMQTHRADLVLLDLIMEPGIDGLETYRRIIQMHPGQRAVITSGYFRTDQMAQALALGMGHHLKKPFVLENLAKCIHEALRKGRKPLQHTDAKAG